MKMILTGKLIKLRSVMFISGYTEITHLLDLRIFIIVITWQNGPEIF